MIRSTYVRLVWIANEFTQVCLNCNADFGLRLLKLQMGITDDHDQLRLFSLASFVLYEDKIHIAGVCLVWKCLNVDFDMPLWNPTMKLPTVHRGNPDDENASLVRFRHPVI